MGGIYLSNRGGEEEENPGTSLLCLEGRSEWGGRVNFYVNWFSINLGVRTSDDRIVIGGECTYGPSLKIHQQQGEL